MTMPLSPKPAIVVVLPRNMHFGPTAATSIDLCAYDSIRYSAMRQGITAVGAALDRPYDDVGFVPVPLEDVDQRRWNRGLCELVERLRPAVIEVHQHLPTAASLAPRFPNVPVVLVRHNYVKPRRNPLKRWHVTAQMRRLAAICFVSDATRADFLANFPAIGGRAVTIPNGIDTARLCPVDGPRERTVVYAGRLVPEKGVLELAQAMARVLPRHPGWRGLFIGGGEADVVAGVAEALAPLGEQAQLLGQRPFTEVMAHFARAEVAAVPSVWQEPFGRTAIEAMAGGAALLTSGRGGLREVAGEAAVYAEPTPEGLARGLEVLITDEALRRAMAAAGRERVVTTFDIRRTVGRMDALRKSLLAGRPITAVLRESP